MGLDTRKKATRSAQLAARRKEKDAPRSTSRGSERSNRLSSRLLPRIMQIGGKGPRLAFKQERHKNCLYSGTLGAMVKRHGRSALGGAAVFSCGGGCMSQMEAGGDQRDQARRADRQSRFDCDLSAPVRVLECMCACACDGRCWTVCDVVVGIQTSPHERSRQTF